MESPERISLLDFMEKIDSANDKYAFIHIIILFAPFVLSAVICISIIKCISKLFFSNSNKKIEIEKKKKLKNEKKKINEDNNDPKMDIEEFSPALAKPSKKKNKKKKKKNGNGNGNGTPSPASTPKISRDYIESQILDISEELNRYSPETPSYPYYPPIAYWKQNYETKNSAPPKQDEWLKMVKSVFVETNKSKGIILKVHLPYSETINHLFNYNKAFINENHEHVEAQYVKGLLAEWAIYRKAFGIVAQPKIKAIHLVDGQPTYFSPENLKKIVQGLLLGCDLVGKSESTIEVHPGITTEEHLKTLYNMGFGHLKITIYDFSAAVIQATNQPGNTYENVATLVQQARQIGYKYIHFECYYNLPKQNLDTLYATMSLITKLEPDQISLKKYEFINWNSHQRNFTIASMPEENDIRPLHLLAIQTLNKSGYVTLGLDEFVKLDGNNPLLEAKKKGKLQYSSLKFIVNNSKEKEVSERYKENKRLIIGLGVTAISDIYYAYAMNTRSIRDYINGTVDKEKFAFINGHELLQNEELIRGAMWNFICEGELKLTKLLIRALSFETFRDIKEAISMGELGLDGIQIKKDGLMVLDGDRIWIKNKNEMLEDNYGTKVDLILPGLIQIFDNSQYRRKRRI